MGASSSAGVASPDAASDPVPQRTGSDELPTSSMPAANGRSSPLMAHPVHLGSGAGEEADEDELLDEEDAGASSVSSVFTMCNSAIGAGVLSLPYAFRCAGAQIVHCKNRCVIYNALLSTPVVQHRWAGHICLARSAHSEY